jgi:hypothetical protein
MRLFHDLIVCEKNGTWFWFDVAGWLKHRPWMPMIVYSKIWRWVFFGIFLSSKVAWVRTPLFQVGIYRHSLMQKREGLFTGISLSSFDRIAYLGRWEPAPMFFGVIAA